MSWSIYAVGSPDKVKETLKKYSESMGSGPSKEEFDKALPNFLSLIDQNFGGFAEQSPVVKFNASGHASFSNGQAQYSRVHVSMEIIEAKL
jgi:hypothetical protein